MNDLIPPKTLLERHPEIGWTANQIGWLLNLGLIQGIKHRRGCSVLPDDVVRLWRNHKKAA